jgi:hypothetical protein
MPGPARYPMILESGVDGLDLLRGADSPCPSHNSSSKTSLLECGSLIGHLFTRKYRVGVVYIATDGNGSALATE